MVGFDMILAIRCTGPSALGDGGLVERGTHAVANFRASSLPQKWMKNMRGSSSSMWLWIAVTSMSPAAGPG
jgi:hypothetical protein